MSTPGIVPTRIGRASAVMALGTVASRGTGFLRTVAITAAIGTHYVGDAYNVANTTPNIIYDLLLGGILTSVVVPVLVRANKEDQDGGDGFASSLLTLVAIGLTIFTVIGMIIAPLIARLYIADTAEVSLATTFMRWFLPQIVFYGIGATIGAILNIRGRFAAPTLAPVLNNLVVIAMAVTFIFLPGPRPPTLHGITQTQITLLGAGTTLGVIVMTLALLPIPSRQRVSLPAAARPAPSGAAPGHAARQLGPGLRRRQPGQLLRRHPAGHRHRLLHHLQQRLPALSAAVRDHRRLADHRATAPDELARRRPQARPGARRPIAWLCACQPSSWCPRH